MDISNERKERILAYMRSKEYVPLKFGELMTVLDVPKEADAELLSILDDLCEEGKIYITRKGRYMSADGNSRTLAGTVECNAKGYFAFLRCDEEGEEDIYIPGDKLGYAINRDRVLVKIDEINQRNGHREGHVIKVLKRSLTVLSGVVTKFKDEMYRVTPDNKKIYYNIRILPQDMMSADIDSRVAVEITSQDKQGKLYGRVLSVLGDKDSLKSCVEGIIIEHGIKQEFDEGTLKEAENAPLEVFREDINGRLDLRDALIFTIDGDNARDFDDAVSIEKTDGGNYLLGVHIADVTHYVKEGSALDNEAFFRGTSVYLADRVIPMLPEKLSNGICSLNPGVDRLTLSVIMEIDKNGAVISHKIEKSVINSKARMTYNNANAILEGDAALREEYGHIAPALDMMNELALILNKKREKRGAIQFDFPETEIIVDSEGEPEDIIKAQRGASNKLIEEFMLAANETVAEYAYWSELPFVYRVHEAPSEEKIKVFNQFILNFGLMIKGKIDEPIHPKALQSVLDAVKDTPEERMVASMMLQSLMKAEYKDTNTGHFGLAANYYCHFTSPIRRYPDLIIHRILKKFICGRLDEKESARLRSIVPAAAANSSKTELEAEYAERDVEDLMKAEYMSAFIGQSFDAIISGVTSFGMFAELENSVEGLIRLESMSDDYYEYNEEENTLTGSRSKQLYRIGDMVRIVVARTDIRLRRIDFVLEKDATAENMRKFEAEDRHSRIVAKRSKIRAAAKKRRKFVKRRGRKNG
ncbi:MAG: ribonuclease R [Clostridiales bacterium]|nr:ribonuclease R [Clostridiales bacterium]